MRNRSSVSVISSLISGARDPKPRACTTSPPIRTATDAAEFPLRSRAASRFASKADQPVGCLPPASSRPGPDGGASSATWVSKARSGSTSNVGSSVARPSRARAASAAVSGSFPVTASTSAPLPAAALSIDVDGDAPSSTSDERSSSTVPTVTLASGGVASIAASTAIGGGAAAGSRLVGSVSAHAVTASAAPITAAAHCFDRIHRTRP